MKKTIPMDSRKAGALILVLALGLAVETASTAAANEAPIADAGVSRYVAQDPVVLDGTDSYDTDSSVPFSYEWQQVAGPPLVMTDADTATPTISGFSQTNAIQECEFELVVSDGELTSLPDTVRVIIVPDFGANALRQENPPFDADKPTIIYFGGGLCITGGTGGQPLWSASSWNSSANVISFPNGYGPDSPGVPRTYYKYGDMVIVYLSAAAPNYNQPIQTSGYSTGGQPAIDVGIHLNLTYADTRYAVNRVTFFDATSYCRDYTESISAFLGSSVEGEQCWADAYVTTTERPGWPANPPHYEANYPPFYNNVLNVWFPTAPGGWLQRHLFAGSWYKASATNSDMNQFNHGVVAGAYWSVIGPGKNLQLASTPDAQTHKFQWHGDAASGLMDFHDEPNPLGQLPEPVTLVGPVDVGDPHGAVLTCEESENAVGYQLVFGSNANRVMDYAIISDTPTPPDQVITALPFEKTWWTVRVCDEFGSTIYADPKPIGRVNLSFPIANISTGKRYGYIQEAIDDALNGDEIVLSEGVYHENINFQGKSLTVTSTSPSEPTVVAATVISGSSQGPTVTYSDDVYAGCLLDGITIIGGTVGICCHGASPMVRNCRIESAGATAIEFWEGYEPMVVDCTILGLVEEQNDPRLVAHWRLDETEGMFATDSAGDNDGMVFGNPVWHPEGGYVQGALEFDGIDDTVVVKPVLNPEDGPFSVFAWVKGGVPGQVIISQEDGTNWLLTDSQGHLMSSLEGGGRRSGGPLISETVITADGWHRVGFTWDGSSRTLYVNDIMVAEDNQPNLQGSAASGGLYIGAGKDLQPGTFWFGLIDDVRIYDRAIVP